MNAGEWVIQVFIWIASIFVLPFMAVAWIVERVIYGSDEGR